MERNVIEILAFGLLGALSLVTDVMPVWLRLPIAIVLLAFTFAAILKVSPSQQTWLRDIFSPWKAGSLYQRLTVGPAGWPRDHRLYDWALRLAVLYPIFLAFLPWLLWGAAVSIGGPPDQGGLEIAPAEPDKFPRLAMLCAIALFLVAPHLEKWGAASPKVFLRKVSGWLPLLAFAVAGAGAVAVAVAFAGAVAVAVAFAGAFAGAFAVAVAVAGAGAVAGAVAVAFAVAGAGAVAVAFAGAVAVAVAFAGATVFFARKGYGRSAYTVLTLAISIALVGALFSPDWTSVEPEGRVVFLFLGLLPLINALFDFISYKITLRFLSFGHENPRLGLPWALADLCAALLLFFLSGAGLVLTVAAANHASGVELFPLARTLAEIGDWQRYWWLYAMAFSTIVPTLLHFGVACFSWTAWFLPAWRLWITDHLDSDDPAESLEVTALIAMFFLGSLIMPVLLIVLLAMVGQLILPGYLGIYANWLLNIACQVDPASCAS